VGGARKAFFNGVPSFSVSYDWLAGKSHTKDFTLSAEAILPIIQAILVEVKNETNPQRCFLNIDLPANVANHKITVTPLGAISQAEIDSQAYFKDWLPRVPRCFS
ncbi:Survival protein SurE-like phosphatase/nucleotidase, partial [Parasponia andersonii]